MTSASILFCVIALCGNPGGTPSAVVDFIRENLPRTVRTAVTNDATMIAVPKPFTVPCADEGFRELYYWDTFFTNLGLLRLGNVEQAKNNVEDIAFLIDRYGYMPNGNRTLFLSRSQPPFFTKMVRDVYEKTQDKAWLGRMYESARREYGFWQERRMTPSDLNRYSGTFDSDEKRRGTAKYFCGRIGVPYPEDDATRFRYAECCIAYCESGWDCTSRFRFNAHEANPICLNSLLYGMESDLAQFAGILGTGESVVWKERAAQRRKRMNELMWDMEKGMFCDYDFVMKAKSDIVSAAAFYPLFVGLATPEQAKRTRMLLPKLEFPYGLAGCEKRDDLQDMQWDYPHGWPPLQALAVYGLRNFGFADEARRIAATYCRTVEKVFAETGNLWEKYDVTTGRVSVSKEYKSPAMLGWTAGAYLYCLEIAGEKRNGDAPCQMPVNRGL